MPAPSHHTDVNTTILYTLPVASKSSSFLSLPRGELFAAFLSLDTRGRLFAAYTVSRSSRSSPRAACSSDVPGSLDRE